MPFLRIDGELYADEVALSEIAAQVGTPCYVYNWQDVATSYRELERAVSTANVRIRYAVKANSNIAMLRRMAYLGAGFDIVSGGELERIIRAGGDPAATVFSGVGKTQQEISFALKVGIGCFNVESFPEMYRIADMAAHLGLRAPVAIRVNPDINVATHPYIATGMRENKFGLPESEAFALAVEVVKDLPSLQFMGLACHIGSQLTELAPYAASLDAMLALRERLREKRIECATLDIGGGFGIRYADEEPLSFDALGSLFAERSLQDIAIEVEPGRSLVGPAGVLLTRVEYLKPAASEGYQDFCVVDAAMNDFIRPSLYGAIHRVEKAITSDGDRRDWNIVGPICETGDFLAMARSLELQEKDLLVIRDAGAYGFVMSSNYNSRPRPAEVMVDGDTWCVARRRETLSDVLELELT